LEATTRFRDLDAVAIPNIIIGMPEETIETYQNTLNYLEQFGDVISHLGICNLAIYENTELCRKMNRHQRSFHDCNELVVHKSFHKDNEDVHEWFHEKLFRLGLEFLG
jgi:coproporphyrinogen III oxidase-like Fe-S oxidoreductase